MSHHIYLPEGVLEKLGELKLQDKTLVTSDGQLAPLGVCAYWALASLVGFTLIYKLSRYYTPLYFKGYKQMSAHDQRDWDTRLGNILYSAYIVYWAVRLVLVDKFFWESGPVPMMWRTSDDSYAALGVSIGFFLMELVITVKYMMGGSAMVVHHIGSLACVLTAAFWGEGHCMTLWMLSTEFTTPFIAFRYLLDKSGLRNHSLYVINGIAILVAWTVARLATFPPFFLEVWNYRDQIRLLQPLSQFLVLVFPVTLALLNIFWYSKIVKGAMKVLGPAKKSAKPAAKTE